MNFVLSECDAEMMMIKMLSNNTFQNKVGRFISFYYHHFVLSRSKVNPKAMKKHQTSIVIYTILKTAKA